MKKVLFYMLVGGMFMACTKESGSSDSLGTGLTNGKGGSMARFAISGNTLFTVGHQSLSSFDISNPAQPVFNAEAFLGPAIETIFPKDNMLFIGSQAGMYIYDVSNPAAPVQLSVYEHIISCDPVVANDDYAYVTLRTSNNGNCFRGINNLEIIDISNPSNPTMVAEYPMVSPKGLGIDANLNLFVCDAGLKMFNATDVLNLDLLEHFTGIDPSDVIPIGNRLLLIGGDGFYQYRLENGQLILLSKIPVG